MWLEVFGAFPLRPQKLLDNSMKRIITVFSFLFCVLTLSAQKNVRIEENFDFDWKFTRIDLPAQEMIEMPFRGGQPGVSGQAQQGGRSRMVPKPRVDEFLAAEKGLETFDYDDSGWETVQTPHDWNIKDKFDELSAGSAASLPEGIGWYRKSFSVPAAMKGKNVTILFDGIFQKSDVYINGHHLGTHPYGFTSVYYDLTPYIKYGEDNLIAVRSSTVGDRPRWYSGGGIYRHVKLIYASPVHVDVYGTYVTTPEITSESATVHVEVTMVTPEGVKASVSHKVYDAGGSVVAKSSTNDLIVANPVLWDIDNPYLYTLETTVKSGGRTVDVYRTAFGIRFFEFDKDKGFSLNGKHLKLQGVAIHQDAGGLGAAVPDRSYERRLEILKEYGCNAIRMAHNQPAKELLDLCDKMGFLVIDEAFDKWKSGYYAQIFDEWWQKDLENMILRDRNHPSIVLWSIGNELSEASLDDNTGAERAAMLQDYVHGLEPTRPVCLAAQNNHKAHFAGVTDVIGYNYLEARAISEHGIYPERRMLITEELPYWCGEEGNIRSYTPENPWSLVQSNDFLAGGFIWSGVDYLGEASSPSRGWPNGLFDICMFEKPRASYHRAMWSGVPTVRVAVRDSGLDQDFGRDIWQWPATKDDWTYPAEYRGRMMDIETVTNCDEVELYQNDRLMGRHKTSDFANNTIIWHLPYSPGSLTARGYINGEMVCEHSIYSTTEIVSFTSEPDRIEICADGQDLSHIVVTLRDKDGHRVQVDEKLVKVKVTGDGRLMAVDSGELRVPTDSFDRDEVLTQYGRALVVVQSTRKSGVIHVEISVDGLKSQKIDIVTR